MSIAGISSSQGILSSRDSYEHNIKKQITALEDKMETISNDDEKPAEEKKKEKQAAQEQLQNLNQELREYQLRKRQEEAEKKREAVKEALASANDDQQPETESEEEELPLYKGLRGEEAGIMLTLSTANEQLAGMVRVRKNLEGKQRTADTEEEKAELQKKIDRVSRGIGQKVSSTKQAVSDMRNKITSDDTQGKPKQPQPNTTKKQEEVFWADTKPSSAEKAAASKQTALHSGKNKLFHDNVSFHVK